MFGGPIKTFIAPIDPTQPSAQKDYDSFAYGIYEGRSLYKFILLYMGVDTDNKPITKSHPLYKAHIELKQVMGKTVWGYKKLQKRAFLSA